MPKICYWRGAIGEEALLELHKQAIQELVDGTYASTDLESLEGRSSPKLAVNSHLFSLSI